MDPRQLPPGVDPTMIPVYPPPPGLESNFTDPPSLAWQPRLAIYTTFPLTVICVCLRVFSRLWLKHGLRADDYLCVLAGISTIGFCGTLLSTVIDDKNGRHLWDLPIVYITPYTYQAPLAIIVLYCVTSTFIKISLLLLWKRMFFIKGMINAMIWIGIIFTAISYVIFMILTITYNVPHIGDGGWLSRRYIDRLLSMTPHISLGLACLGLVTDVYVLVIPLITVAQLKMSLKKKAMVSALFATGLLACALSAAGVNARLDNYRAVYDKGVVDSLWESMRAYALVVAEVNLGIVCSCTCVIFPLVKTAISQSRSAWSSWRESREKPTEGSDGTGESRETSTAHRGRPRAPKGPMRGLMSFVAGQSGRGTRASGYGRTEVGITRTVDIETAPFSELRSVDMDYHAHIAPHRHDAASQAGSSTAAINSRTL